MPATHNVLAGDPVALNAGTAGDWTFLGWFRAAEVPATNSTVSPIAANGLRNFTMPDSDVEYVAVWGDQHGVVGRRNERQLTISNMPSNVVLTQPQTTSGPQRAGDTVGLEGGAVYGRTFLGWWEGGSVPTSGNISELVGNPQFWGIVPNFVMPNANVELTALWGNRTGTISNPNANTLTTFNYPGTVNPVGASHTVGSREVNAGVTVNLAAGTAGNWTFLGWYRGDAVPASGTTVSPVPLVNTHSFEMPDSDVVYVAVWGNQAGVVGTRNSWELTVMNQPEQSPVPTGQTVSGQRLAGDNVVLTSGSVYGYTFMGWWIGANVPSVGTAISTIDVSDQYRATTVTTMVMPDGNTVLTALWGNGTVIGLPNARVLTMSNFPVEVAAVGASPSPSPVTLNAGAEVTINAGTATNWTFLGWYRSNAVPAAGTTVTPIPVTNTREIVMPDSNLHYVAVWGNQNGVVGTRNTWELTVENMPSTVTLLTAQIVSGPRVAGESVHLNAGMAYGFELLGWWIGTGVPTTGNIADYDQDARFIAPGTFFLTMPDEATLLTAIWGSRGGGIGTGNQYQLTINNIPAGIIEHLISQTVTGNHAVGAEITLNAGTAPEGWYFVGWYIGANAPNLNNIGNLTLLNDGDEITMVQGGMTAFALWGSDGGNVGYQELTVNNQPTMTVANQMQSGLRRAGQTALLNPGTANGWTFLGWWVGGSVPGVGVNVSTLGLPQFIGQATSFTMPYHAETVTALWGNEDGYIGVIQNLTVNVINAQGGAAIGHATLTLAGEPVTSGVNGTFTLGSEARLGDVLIATATGFAPSGNRAIVSGDVATGIIDIALVPIFTVTFNAYDGTDGTHDVIIVNPNQTINEVITPEIAAVTHIWGTGTDASERGWAFWGWFTDEALDAEDRLNPETGLRRPTVGTNGFGFNTELHPDMFDEYNNLDLYAIWAIWGDANDDDRFTHADLILVQSQLLGQAVTMNTIAANVASVFNAQGNPNITHASLVLMQSRLLGQAVVFGRQPL